MPTNNNPMTNLAAAVESLRDAVAKYKTARDCPQSGSNHDEIMFANAMAEFSGVSKNFVRMHAETILAELGTGAGGDDMLPDALIPVSKEWYVLCERRFAVDKITISGDLARAIVDAMCNKPSPIEMPTYQYVPVQRVGQSTEEYEQSVLDEASEILASRNTRATLTEWVEEYEVWQDDVLVAGAAGKGSLQEALHYAAQYEKDGPVTIYKVTRRVIDNAQATEWK